MATFDPIFTKDTIEEVKKILKSHYFSLHKTDPSGYKVPNEKRINFIADEICQLFESESDESRLLTYEDTLAISTYRKQLERFAGEDGMKLWWIELLRFLKAQDTKTASIKDAECQVRVERIKRELEEKVKSGSYQSGTYHFYSILVETWQEFWKQEGVK